MRCLALILLCFLVVSANAKQQSKTDKDFNNYVEGAMLVYSQFQTPSKKESEEFYNFIKSKWSTSHCSNNCVKHGYIAGSEYAEKKNIPTKNKDINISEKQLKD